MNTAAYTFALYLVVAGNTTYFLGRSLYTKGEPFLYSIFTGRAEIVQPLNKVLLTGFYLINLGFVLSFFTQQESLPDWRSALEFLSWKLGMVYLVLGALHGFNIIVFITIERKFSTNPKR